jgi:hypothetical protein
VRGPDKRKNGMGSGKNPCDPRYHSGSCTRDMNLPPSVPPSNNPLGTIPRTLMKEGQCPQLSSGLCVPCSLLIHCTKKKGAHCESTPLWITRTQHLVLDQMSQWCVGSFSLIAQELAERWSPFTRPEFPAWTDSFPFAFFKEPPPTCYPRVRWSK